MAKIKSVVFRIEFISTLVLVALGAIALLTS
jgi:hypothetical protein